MLSFNILKFVRNFPNCSTSDIENYFMQTGNKQASILGSIGYLRSQNLIQITGMIARHNRIEHYFA